MRTWMAVVVLLTGCVGELGDGTGDPEATGVGTTSGGGVTAGTGGSTGAMTGSGGETSGAGGSTGVGGGAGGNDEVAEVCDRWNADRAMLGEGMWSGNVGACDAGDVSADGRANALAQVNLYRWLGGLPAVTTDPQRDQRAQDCALMMHANGALDHSPPTGWNCYTANGAQAAGASNIATGPGVTAVDMYMSDWGNETTIGHRRWILSNSLGAIGLGTTSGYSCMTVIGGGGNANAAWMAFPSEGVFPVEALTASFQSVDATGWTIQSDGINLNGAQVSVTDDGNEVPVSVVNLLSGYGSAQALKVTPNGWTSQADHTYHVSVTGASEPIEYDVHMVACE